MVGYIRKMAPFRKLRTRLGLRRPKALPQIEGLSIGKHTYGLSESSVYSASKHSPLTIGAFCSIATEVVFICHGRLDHQFTSTYPFRQNLFGAPLELDSDLKRGIEVGHDVWIGRRAMIMPGVSIGTGAVIAAGSVVTSDVPPYAIFGGNPARLIRYRFPEETIRELLDLRWWDWSESDVREHVNLLQGPAEQFLQRFRGSK